MLLYRLAKCRYADDLTGTGARLYGGRWNSEGRAMVYTASSRSLALLEVLVHVTPANLPADFCMMVIDAPGDVEEIDPMSLPLKWQEYPEINALKSIGNSFLQRANHLLLRVPSAIVKEEYNYLINPNHPKAREVKVADRQSFAFDARLVPASA
jgi:RES domain-containing protein